MPYDLIVLKIMGESEGRLEGESNYQLNKLERDIREYSKITKDTHAFEAGGNVKETAMREESDLLMINRNYKYILWTAGVVALAAVGARAAQGQPGLASSALFTGAASQCHVCVRVPAMVHPFG